MRPPLFADENIPRRAVLALREHGFDITYIAEGGTGTLDPEVLRRAGGYLLLTADRDFGMLVYAQSQAPPIGVVYLRLGAARPDAVEDRLVSVLSEQGRVFAGVFTVVEPHRTRERPLPPPA